MHAYNVSRYTNYNISNYNICFSNIITCGHDGDVRIWVDIEDDDPNSHCVGESALAVCFKEKRLYVATDNHVVQAYTYPAFDKDGIVTRFTAPVTHIKSTNKIEVCIGYIAN